MARKITLLVFLCLVSLAARADEVFKWVDENGKVHYGDTVPEKYRQESKKVDSSSPEVTDAQRQEAEARNAKEKARLDALEKSRDARVDVAPHAAPPPPEVLKTGDECEEQMRKYLQSQECFAPYRNANGGINPEAFQRCTEVKQPMGCVAPAGSVERTYIPPAP